MSFKDNIEAERVKDKVKEGLKSYLQKNGVEFTSDRNFKCFNKGFHKNGDKNSSAGLSSDGKGYKCHACDSSGDIFNAVEFFENRSIEGKDFFDTLAYLADEFGIQYEKGSKTNTGSNNAGYDEKKITAVNKFIDSQGEVRFISERTEFFKNGERVDKKDFPKTYDNAGKLVSGFKGKSRILYRLPQLLHAVKEGKTIFFTEGMKCADIVAGLGLESTAIWGGANAWVKPHIKNYIKDIIDSKVVILPDNDKAGKKFAEKVADGIKDVVESVKILDLNESIAIPEGGDIEEWLELGGTKEKLIELADSQHEYESRKVQFEKDLEDWYSVNPNNGSVTVLTGVLARHLTQNVKAIHSTSKFFLYKDGVYIEADEALVEGIAKDHIRDKYCKSNLIKDAVHQWRVDRSVRRDAQELNAYPQLINFKNGLFDVKKNQFREHTDKFLSTVQLNANYDPETEGEVFLKFLEKTLPSESTRLLIQEFMGYMLTNYVQAKKMFLFKGDTNTGKSTLLNCLEHIIGKRNIAHVPLQNLNEEHNIAEIFGKVANIVADLPDKPIRDAGTFKMLLGQDTVQARRKFGHPFSFTSKAKHVFACNNLPENYGDTSDGFYEKFIIVSFDNRVPSNEIDTTLPKKLEKEADFIASWALEGLKRLMDNDFRFTETVETKKLRAEFKMKSNPVLHFVGECCVLADELEVGSVDLYKSYVDFHEAEYGETSVRPTSSRKFQRELMKNFSTVKKALIGTRRIAGFKGIDITVNDESLILEAKEAFSVDKEKGLQELMI